MGLHLTAALRRARDAARAPVVLPGAGRATARPVRIAVGDPQAPLETFLRLLDQHGLITPYGALRDDVLLVSMGDHFDWGKVEDRAQAAEDGRALLAWLVSHPADQVVVLAGNHDLSRVTEFAAMDDAAYVRARAEADTLYRAPAPDPAAERRFLENHPQFASAESLARDLSTFSTAQRTLVRDVLRAGRFRLAYAVSPHVLCVHGGLTHDDLVLAGVAPGHHADAFAIARSLNAFFDGAVDRWDRSSPLDLRPLHQPQSLATGEGRGILYQRPAHPDACTPQELRGPPRRRYDPRTLPGGLTQIVGHIRDNKCRELMAPWAMEPPRPEGGLRHLLTDGARVVYRAGPPPSPAGAGEACVIFTDGGMSHAAIERYALLELDALAQLPRVEHGTAPSA